MPWIPFAIAAGLTLVKMKTDSDQQAKTGQIKAAQERYSPWTKLKPDQDIKQADYGGDLIKGAGMGLAGWGAMQGNPVGASQAVAANAGAGAAPPAFKWDSSNLGSFWDKPPQFDWTQGSNKPSTLGFGT